MGEHTTERLSREFVKSIKSKGLYGESFEQILWRLLGKEAKKQ